MTEPLTYTVEQAAQLLGVSRGVAYESVRRGEIPGAIRLGRRVVISRHALMSLLNADEPVGSGLVGKTPEDARHDRSYS